MQHAVGLDVALEELLPAQRLLPGRELQPGWRTLREDGARVHDSGAALVWAHRC